MVNHSRGKCSFKIFYTHVPRLNLDLANLPVSVDLSVEATIMADRIKNIHEEVRAHLETTNKSYKKQADTHKRTADFKIGDLVMVHLNKSRLPTGLHSKLTNKKISPFPILAKFGPNTYQIDLPPTMKISSTFNVSNIYHYQPPDQFELT